MQRLRTRLIAACLCVAILPAVPLSLVVRNLLELIDMVYTAPDIRFFSIYGPG